jgi:hypothetical protein
MSIYPRTEILERAAKAICKNRGWQWDKVSDRCRTGITRTARAALSALSGKTIGESIDRARKETK